MKIKVKRVQPLTYNTRLIGLRVFLTNGDILDADKPSLHKEGVYNINLPDHIPLILTEGILISQEEIAKGLTTEDISEDKERLSALVEVLKRKDKFAPLFTFQKPYEQSLKVFMEDDTWQVVRVDRTDEYKNQHHIVQPDGKRYKGGWIGSARTEEKAKLNFHRDQVRWALHRGNTVFEEALMTYPDLKQYSDIIAEIKQKVKVETDENKKTKFKIVDTNHTSPLIAIENYPYKDRIAQRGYVSYHKLIPESIQNIELIDMFLDRRELTIIAINRAIYEHLKKPIKDQYYENIHA